MILNSRFLFGASLVALVAAGVSPAAAQSANPANLLTRSLDNPPHEQGATMANELAGQNVLTPDDAAVTGDSPAAIMSEFPSGAPVFEGIAPDEEGEVAVEAPVAAGEAAALVVEIDPTAPAGTVVAEESVTIPAAGLTPARDYDEEGDPITQRAIQLLDETGTLGRQRQLSEAMILMDQRLRFNKKIEELLVALGPDAEIEVAPGVFRSYEGTPAATRARIAQIQLEQELAEAMGEAPDVADTAAPVDPAANLPVRDDGTTFQDMPPPVLEAAQAPAPAEPDAQDRIAQMLAEAEARFARREAELRRISSEVETRAAEAIEVEEEEITPGLRAVSLREIYGAAGVYAAIVDVAGTRSEVRLGDEVAGYDVSRIGSTFIELSKDGESTRISL